MQNARAVMVDTSKLKTKFLKAFIASTENKQERGYDTHSFSGQLSQEPSSNYAGVLPFQQTPQDDCDRLESASAPSDNSATIVFLINYLNFL